MFCIFFIPFVSIASCFLYRSMVPCSLCSLYVSFLSISDQVFWLSMPFDNRVKRGEKLEIWMPFLRGSNKFWGGGEFHVRGKKIFDVTNLGGELVWYTLIMIYSEMCIFVLHSHAMIEIFLLFIPLALWIKVFLSLFILLVNVFHMVPWCFLFSAF